MTKKKDEKETESKKASSAKKECLIDLVEKADAPLFMMMMDLSRLGWDKQLGEEVRLRRLGLPIEPSITESEFNKEILGE